MPLRSELTAREALSKVGRALHTLQTDNIEGHTLSSGANLGHSMRTKVPSVRVRLAGEPVAEAPIAAVSSAMSTASAARAARALRALNTNTIEGHALSSGANLGRSMRTKVPSVRVAGSMGSQGGAAIEARGKAAKEGAQVAGAKAEPESKKLHANAEELRALRAARTLLVAPEATSAIKARSKEQKKALEAALVEADTALERSALVKTPAPKASVLKTTQMHAEGPAGRSAKWSSGMQVVAKRWDLFMLIYGEEFELKEGAPTMEMAKAFVTFSHGTRLRMSADGKEGRGDGADNQHRCVHVPGCLQGA